MPRIYTKDIVGEMIEDEFLGSQGISTGSYANMLALERRRAEQNSKDSARARAQAAQDAADASINYFPPVNLKPDPDPVLKAIGKVAGDVFFGMLIIGFIAQLFG